MMVSEVQELPVFAASALRVVDGVAIGDILASAEDLILDDVYQLGQEHSATSHYGASFQLDACLTFMAPTGATLQVLLLTADDGVFFLPLGQMRHAIHYRLICCEQQTAVSLLNPETVTSFQSIPAIA